MLVAVTVFESGSRPDPCPTWEEMCFIKNIFWEEEESAMQLHPPKSDYVNNHPSVYIFANLKKQEFLCRQLQWLG